MRSTNRVYSYAKKYLCMILVCMLCFISLPATAHASSASSVPSQNLDRYDGLGSVSSPSSSSGSVVTDPKPEESKEELEVKEFNGRFLDTVIYILGGISGFIMILQISAYCMCRMFPTLNEWVAKLDKIGITGYEDSILVFCVKVGLLGMLSYLCISGIMKMVIGYIMGFLTNLFF